MCNHLFIMCGKNDGLSVLRVFDYDKERSGTPRNFS